MRDIDYGTVRIKLNELIEQQGISKNRLAHRAEMQRTQLNQYCNGEVTRLDIAVLARLCCALDCKVEDLLEYVPPVLEPGGIDHSESSRNNQSELIRNSQCTCLAN